MENKRELEEKRQKITSGLEKAYEKMVNFKKYKKTPIVVSENGEILELDPNDASPTTTYSRVSLKE